jgi:hypothetical protein
MTLLLSFERVGVFFWGGGASERIYPWGMNECDRCLDLLVGRIDGVFGFDGWMDW